MVCPHAGVAIGLQLAAHRIRLGAGAAARHARSNSADQVLDVVAVFVRDDIGLRELARRAEAIGELVEEREIEIDVAVARAIKRAGGRLAFAAAGRGFSIVDGERGRRETRHPLARTSGVHTSSAEPTMLAGELERRVVGARAVFAGVCCAGAPPGPSPFSSFVGIDAEQQRDDDNSDQPQAAAAHREVRAVAAKGAAAVLHIVAGAKVVDAHRQALKIYNAYYAPARQRLHSGTLVWATL